MRLLAKVWRFLLQPEYVPLHAPQTLRAKLFFAILGLYLVLAMASGLFLGLVKHVLQLDLGEHALDTLSGEHSFPVLFFMAVVVAPILEELFFRAPMALFKNSKYFPLVFYLLTIGFAAVHLFNFEAYQTHIWLAPLLILPQLIGGVFLGYIRVKLGLVYSITMHSLFNGVILGPFLLSQLANPQL